MEFEIILKVLTVVILLLFAYALLYSWVRSARKQPNNKDFMPIENKPLNKRRDELISYIFNKTLDAYEDSLLKELEKSSDSQLQKIVLNFQLIDSLPAVKKDVDV